MTTLPLGRQAKRTYHGMQPEFYSKVDFLYPSPTTTEIIFSYTDDDTGNRIVNAIIELVYTDATQVALTSAERLL